MQAIEKPADIDIIYGKKYLEELRTLVLRSV